MADRRPPLSHDEATELTAAFVLGALSPDEMDAMRTHLATCHEPHEELEILGAVVPSLARSVEEASPPPGLGERIMAAARAPARTSIATPAATPTESPVTGPRDVPRAERAPSRPGPFDVFRRPAWAFAAIAALLVIVLGAWNLQLQGQVNDLTAYRDGVVAVMDTATASGGQLAVVSGSISGGPTGLAAVGPDGKVVMAMRNLDPTTGTQVYEAWLIAGSNAPVPVGSFTVGSRGTGALTATAGGSGAGVVVALTREPGPGATTPTLPIVAQGQAHASSGSS